MQAVALDRGPFARLNDQSVRLGFVAYTDIPWDAPDHAVDLDDGRFALGPDDPLGATAWYREFLLRVGLGTSGMDRKFGSVVGGLLHRHLLVWAAGVMPELFMLCVLAGEAEILYGHRIFVTQTEHPLLEKVFRLHTRDEARHVAFARAWLARRKDRIGWFQRRLMQVVLPLLVRRLARTVYRLSPTVIRQYGIPAAVVREAWDESPVHADRIDKAFRETRETCRELGGLTPRTAWLWRRLGVAGRP